MSDEVLKTDYSASGVVRNLRLFTAFSVGGYLLALVTGISGMEIFSVCSLISILVLSCLGQVKFKVQNQKLFLTLCCFGLAYTLSVLLGPADNAYKFKDIFRLRFLLFYVTWVVIFTQVFQFRKFVRPWAGVVLLIALYGILQHFVSIDWFHPEGKKIYSFAIQSEKIGPLTIGTFSHHLTFANTMLFVASIFLSLGFGNYKKYRVELCVGVLTLLACFWTQSRAAWVAMPFVLITILRFKLSYKTAVALGFLACLFAFSMMFDQGFSERLIRTLFKRDSLYNLDPRFRLWQLQWEIFKENIWFGVGPNNNERLASEYMTRFFPAETNAFLGHAHSIFLQILSTMGLVGAVSFLGVVAGHVAHFRRHVKAKRITDNFDFRLLWGIAAGFVGFLIQGFTQWNLGDAEVLHHVVFWLALFSTVGLS